MWGNGLVWQADLCKCEEMVLFGRLICVNVRKWLVWQAKWRKVVWFGRRFCINMSNGLVWQAFLCKYEEMVWFGRRICIPVKKRFPTLQHLVESGILNDNEREIIQKIDEMYIQVKNAALKNGTSFCRRCSNRPNGSSRCAGSRCLQNC